LETFCLPPVSQNKPKMALKLAAQPPNITETEY